MATTEIQSKADDEPIQYCSNVILKEAKQERRLVNQTLYAMLSAYTNNPINLAINSPSGEGKSHVLHKVGDLFPSEDIMFVAGMTDKALFHRPGKLVIKNEAGDYESIEERSARIDSEIEDKQCEVSASKDPDFKQARQNLIKELQKQKDDLRKHARKLIDLSHKIIVFQDTPNPGLLIALMPLLSHDKYQVEYEFVDTYNEIKTKTNILRGWPAVIFSQAIDYSQYKRYPEIQRRFIITNPKMSTEKYSDAVRLAGERFGLPDFAYQREVVSDSEKEKAKEIIKDIKQKISLICDRLEPGKNNVIIPFYETVTAALSGEKASDMTAAKRLFSIMCLSALINVDERPRYMLRKEGHPILQTIPFVTFEDLRESVSFMEDAGVDGVRPYILEWYSDVFLVKYNEKEPDSAERKSELLSEKRIALTTEDLAAATDHIQKKKYSTKQILENYIDPLVNQGYIDKADSDLDKRKKIYYPIVTSKIRKLFDLDQSNNILQRNHISITNPLLYPDKRYIISKIRRVLRYSSEEGCNIVEKIVSHDNTEISIEQVVETYYSNPEDYFETSARKDSVPDEYFQNRKITCELQVGSADDIGSRKQNPEICKELFDDHKSNNFLFSCYYCEGYETNEHDDYERHVVIKHPKKVAYPGKADLDSLGLQPKGKDWETVGS